jgi:hypothetical protein
VAGDVRVSGFATLLLDGSVVAGDLVCELGADALCVNSRTSGGSACHGCTSVGARAQ